MAVRALDATALAPLLRRRRRKHALDLPPLGKWLAESLELALQIFPADEARVLLTEPRAAPETATLRLVASYGTDTDALGQAFSQPETLMQALPEGGDLSPVLAQDPANAAWLKALCGEVPACCAAAPIYIEQTVCGILVFGRKRAQALGEVELATLKLVAGYIGRATENAVDLVKQRELALQDDLTGLGNVRRLSAELAAQVAQADAEDAALSVAFLDLDHLKQINDQLGHSAGSAAIRRCAQLLAHGCNAQDQAYRFGGDELVWVLPGRDLEAAQKLAEGIVRRVRESTSAPQLSVSIGVAELRQLRATLEARGHTLPAALREAAPLAQLLLSAADRAMYRAKALGRDRVACMRADDLR